VYVPKVDLTELVKSKDKLRNLSVFRTSYRPLLGPCNIRDPLDVYKGMTFNRAFREFHIHSKLK